MARPCRNQKEIMYDDDEPIVVNSTLSEDNSDFSIGGKTGVTVDSNTEAPLEKTEFKVLFKLLGAGSGKDRPGVDLVAVLDCSGSMRPDRNPAREDRIAKLKMAMLFVIKKLSPIDRLSVVKFSSKAQRLCPLRQMTETCQTEIEQIIGGLVAVGDTNILAGLQEGLKVLGGRRLTTGRVVAIMLMSDGEQKIDQFPDINVPVHTFGVGQQYDPRVLQAIAAKSRGGTISDVQKDNLSIAFSLCLAGLLTVAVQDLKLTLTVQQDQSEIVNVSAGDYPKSQAANSVTISFGDLYDKELRRVKVDLSLPAVTSSKGANVLFHTYSYKTGAGIQFTSALRDINISRVETEVGPEKEEIMQEEYRLQTIDTMRNAKDMAEERDFEGATNKLVDGQSFLEDMVPKPNAFIQGLISELEQLVKLMQDVHIYDSQGRAYALSALTSHDRQRAAARGDEVEKGGLYTTPRMDAYLEQAQAFMEDPSQPVPTVDDDVEQEIRADPLGSIAGTLSYYLQTAIESLVSIRNIINKRSR